MIGVMATYWRHRQAKDDLVCVKENTHSYLLGRKNDLLALNNAWHDETANLFLLTALGGTGKTALLQEWLSNLESCDWQGADNVYAWSFPDISDSSDLQALTEEFLHHALEWFGNDQVVPKHPVEQINLLGKLIQRQRTLLLLDNFPTLELTTDTTEQKTATSQPLGILLNCLAAYNPGLCVVATRQALPVCNKTQPHIVQYSLGDLSTDSAAILLLHRGVDLAPPDRSKIAQNFCGHALTLTLLGSYMANSGQYDISNILAWRDSNREGLQTRRVLAVMENWLWNTPELLLVYLISLLDRPVTQKELFVLLHSQRQPWFRRWLKPDETLKALAPLSKLSVRDFSKVQRQLYRFGLISASPATGALDTHALLRGYFRERVQARYPDIPTRLQELLEACIQQTSTAQAPGDVSLDNGRKAYALPDLQSAVQATRSLGVKLEKSALGKHWYRASIIANHLCEHHLILGNLSAAVYCARRGVAYAELSHDHPSLIQNMKLLTSLLRLTGSQREALLLLQRVYKNSNKPAPVTRLKPSSSHAAVS